MSLEDDVRDLARRVSELARNSEGQWLRIAGGGGGGSGDATLQAVFMVVTTAIMAATGDTSEITPGGGYAQKYQTDSDLPHKRTPTEEEPVAVFNYDTTANYPIGTEIWCSTDSNGLIEVISASCGVLDAGS